MIRPKSSMMTYVISFVFIISILISVNMLLNTEILKTLVKFYKSEILDLNKDLSSEIMQKHFNKLNTMQIQNLEALNSYFEKLSDQNLLCSAIYTETQDENYFLTRNIIYYDKSFKLPFKKGNRINASESTKYIKNALLSPALDPNLEKLNNSFWQNAFFPVKINNRTYVIQLSINTAEINNIENESSAILLSIRKKLLIVSILTLGIILIISLLYIFNLNLFINGLTNVVKDAAHGKMSFKINEKADSDFKDLAYSFNSLIGGIQEKDKKIEELSEKDYLDDIFKKGVEFLKKGDLVKSENIFKTLTIFKPDAFGSFFNLGVIYAKQKDYRISLEMFNKALTAHPGHEMTVEYISKVKKRLDNAN